MEREAWTDSFLNLPIPAVVCLLQPRALPPVLGSPHHRPAEDTRGECWWVQQVHPCALALVGWRWVRRTEGVYSWASPAVNWGFGQPGRGRSCSCQCPVQQGSICYLHVWIINCVALISQESRAKSESLQHTLEQLTP